MSRIGLKYGNPTSLCVAGRCADGALLLHMPTKRSALAVGSEGKDVRGLCVGTWTFDPRKAPSLQPLGYATVSPQPDVYMDRI